MEAQIVRPDEAMDRATSLTPVGDSAQAADEVPRPVTDAAGIIVVVVVVDVVIVVITVLAVVAVVFVVGIIIVVVLVVEMFGLQLAARQRYRIDVEILRHTGDHRGAGSGRDG